MRRSLSPKRQVLFDTSPSRSEAGPTGAAFSEAALSRDAPNAASPSGSGGSGWSDLTAATIRSITADNGVAPLVIGYDPRQDGNDIERWKHDNRLTVPPQRH